MNLKQKVIACQLALKEQARMTQSSESKQHISKKSASIGNLGSQTISQTVIFIGWKTKYFVTLDCSGKADDYLKRFMEDPKDGVCKNETKDLRQTLESKSAVKLCFDFEKCWKCWRRNYQIPITSQSWIW